MPPRPLAAFYTYSAACGVFSCVSTGLFMPIFLEQLARRHGRSEPLRVGDCFLGGGEEGRCSVQVMGVWVDTAAYSLYTKSINVALQAITLISISVLADIPRWRNRLITSLAALGSILAATFIILPTALHASLYAASILVVITSVSLSDSYVCLNAMLPELAHGSFESGNEETTALIQDIARTSMEIIDLPTPAPPIDAAHSSQTTVAQISSRGIAIGFGAGVTALSISLIPVFMTGGSLGALKGVIGASGVAWAVLTTVMWVWLPSTRGMDAEGTALGGAKDGEWELVKNKVWQGWQRLGSLVDGKEVRRLRVTYWYLLASALLQDAFNTTLAVSILFAKTSLSMSPAQVILVGLLMQLTAVGSAAITPSIQRRYGWDGIQCIVICIAMGIGMCAYGLLGLVCPWAGLRSSGEMYVAAVWFGLLYGPYDSLARSVLVDFIPPGHQARFFSLFSITDKSASFLGPAAIAFVADWTGDIRYGFAVLAVLMVVPVPILWLCVDVERGKRDARAYR